MYGAKILCDCLSLGASRMVISVANVRECDEFGGEYGGSVVDVDAVPEQLTSPFWTKWIVPLILPIIVDTPTINTITGLYDAGKSLDD